MQSGSLNCTVPVGVPEPGALAVTVTVKVTAWPNADGLAEETTFVVVASLLTFCVSAVEVLYESRDYYKAMSSSDAEK